MGKPRAIPGKASLSSGHTNVSQLFTDERWIDWLAFSKVAEGSSWVICRRPV
jgi:hypothetical protein